MLAFLRAKISTDPKFLLVRCLEPALNFSVNSQLFKNIGLPIPCKFFYHYPNFCLIEHYHIWWNSNCLCYLWQYCYSICSGKRHLWICDPFQSALPSSMFLAAITGFSFNRILYILRSSYLMNLLICPHGLEINQRAPLLLYQSGLEKWERSRCF